MIAYKLKFTAPLHVDSRGTSFYEKAEEFVRSDTLTAAVISCWRHIYEDSMEDVAANPPFLLSSAFPYYSGIYFFPRPLIKVFQESENLSEAKVMKKVGWLSRGLFEQVLSGNRINWVSSFAGPFGSAFAISAEESACLSGNGHSIVDVHERPRIAVDRTRDSVDEGAFFYFAECHFAETAGLFFLARFANGQDRRKFESVLRLLGDQGLGADRSAGKGTFIPEVVEPFVLDVPEKPDRWLVLSLYNPIRSEIEGGLLENASYDFTTRGGWIAGTSFKKPPIKMFTEGSVFSRKPEGRTVKLLSPARFGSVVLKHPVFRHGKSFCVPMRGEQ